MINLNSACRHRIHELMWQYRPDGSNLHFPGKIWWKICCKPLTSIGRFHEIPADGHENWINKLWVWEILAFQYMLIRTNGLEWSWGFALYLTLVTYQVPLAISFLTLFKSGKVSHLFSWFSTPADSSTRYTFVVDNWQGFWDQMANHNSGYFQVGIYQTILVTSLLIRLVLSRQFYAPNVDMDIYPPSVTLPSTCNTVIESLWRWLHKKAGLNLHDIILTSKYEHCFHRNNEHHQ